MAINLSAFEFHQRDVAAEIASILAQTGLAPRYLEIELTETVLMQHSEQVLRTLQSIKSLGVGLAIDDFGTGYSSLSYLKRLPLDILKIDQSFIRGLPDDPNDAAIARAIIALGRSMQLTIIAEGVETPAQQEFLAAEGCEQIQGYIVSLPLPPNAFAESFLRIVLSDLSDGTAWNPSI